MATPPIQSSSEPDFMHSTAPLTGIEWVIDASGCDPERLCDLRQILSICEQVVLDLELNVVGTPHVHQFPAPGGVTALYLLSESHLACHTYPEYSLATFNLYCCRNREAWDWKRKLTETLSATDVSVRQLVRGQR